ncbi:MAG: cobalt ECF transporter T component CbiQ [Kineosporiaceae bacterium]|nr:cobalt ECF transporter T component CbiQ [Kineosporiaceae bacterium]
MGSDHAHRLYVPGASVVHRLGPQCKLVATVAFVILVVLTPARQMWAFALYALVLAVVAAVAHIPAPTIARRMLVEVPFVVFALAMPFLTPGDRVEVAGIQLSSAGLWSAWNVLAKATVGVVTSILLAATTDLRMLLLGLERLRLPGLLVQIMTFMVRYSDVITDEMRRMRIARLARGFEARDIRSLPVLAHSAGALFIRSYERGERVHLAMLSRGYTGSMPSVVDIAAPTRDWALALALPAVAIVILTAARVSA